MPATPTGPTPRFGVPEEGKPPEEEQKGVKKEEEIGEVAQRALEEAPGPVGERGPSPPFTAWGPRPKTPPRVRRVIDTLKKPGEVLNALKSEGAHLNPVVPFRTRGSTLLVYVKVLKKTDLVFAQCSKFIADMLSWEDLIPPAEVIKVGEGVAIEPPEWGSVAQEELCKVTTISAHPAIFRIPKDQLYELPTELGGFEETTLEMLGISLECDETRGTAFPIEDLLTDVNGETSFLIKPQDTSLLHRYDPDNEEHEALPQFSSAKQGDVVYEGDVENLIYVPEEDREIMEILFSSHLMLVQDSSRKRYIVPLSLYTDECLTQAGINVRPSSPLTAKDLIDFTSICRVVLLAAFLGFQDGKFNPRDVGNSNIVVKKLPQRAPSGTSATLGICDPKDILPIDHDISKDPEKIEHHVTGVRLELLMLDQCDQDLNLVPENKNIFLTQAKHLLSNEKELLSTVLQALEQAFGSNQEEIQPRLTATEERIRRIKTTIEAYESQPGKPVSLRDFWFSVFPVYKEQYDEFVRRGYQRPEDIFATLGLYSPQEINHGHE